MSNLINEYSKRIQEEKDPIWKKVLIHVSNWDHIVEVCGSTENAIFYLEKHG